MIYFFVRLGGTIKKESFYTHEKISCAKMIPEISIKPVGRKKVFPHGFF